MSMAEVIALLQQENERLRRENEILLLTVKQIRETVNRLLERYVLNEGAEQIYMPKGSARHSLKAENSEITAG